MTLFLLKLDKGRHLWKAIDAGKHKRMLTVLEGPPGINVPCRLNYPGMGGGGGGIDTLGLLMATPLYI